MIPICFYFEANNAKVFYGLIHDPELNAAVEEDSDEEEDKEKPKVEC